LFIKNRLFLKRTSNARPQYSKDGRKLIKKGYSRYFFEAYQEPENKQILDAALAKIRAMSESKIPVLFVIHTELKDMDPYLFTEIHETVKKMCHAYGFPVLDPLADMLAYKASSLRISRANIHPNAMGNKVLVRAISRYLRANSIVK
jgi:hypothetical protein